MPTVYLEETQSSKPLFRRKSKKGWVAFQVSILKVNPILCQKGPLRYMGKSQTLCIISRCIQPSASPNPKGAPNPTYFHCLTPLSSCHNYLPLPHGSNLDAPSQVVQALFFPTHFCFQYLSLLHCVYVF